jgi:hypothetical protein
MTDGLTRIGREPGVSAGFFRFMPVAAVSSGLPVVTGLLRKSDVGKFRQRIMMLDTEPVKGIPWLVRRTRQGVAE